MRQRWLSRRALLLHIALAVWFPGCLVAFWWQVHRAFSGNGLSYLYSVEWPVFALTGVWAWWQLVHIDPETVGQRAQARLAAQRAGSARPASVAPAASVDTAASVDGPASDDGPATVGTPASAAVPVDGRSPSRRREDESPDLAAYNDRLARLATEGPKTWRRR